MNFDMDEKKRTPVKNPEKKESKRKIDR